ncbi:MAG: hypothetical protein WC663_03825 [Patescibacteria group bacterium]|jgi:hypothetical protein
MRKLLILSLFAIAATMLFIAPNALAFDITTDSISTNDSTNPATIVDTPTFVQTGVTSDSFNVVYSRPGATYTGVFTLSGSSDDLMNAPVLVISGGKIQSYAWDASSHKATVVWIGDEYEVITQRQKVTASAVVFIRPALTNPTKTNFKSVEPPTAMAGGYISTGIKDWTISTPSALANFGFGLSMTGISGNKSYYKMYVPKNMLNVFTSMGKLTVLRKHLAIFIDNYQASIKKTKTANGGAIFNLEATFSTGNTETTPLTTTLAKATKTAPVVSKPQKNIPTVTKTITVQKKKKLSTAFKKGNLNIGQTAKIYGWLRSMEKGKTIKIYYKKKGTTTYNYLTSVKTVNLKGYYSYSFATTKVGTYNYKVKNAKGTIISKKAVLITQ